MKYLALVSGVVLLASLVGCASSQPSALDPTPQEAVALEKFKLPEQPAADEALVYVINRANNEKQRVRSVYVKVGDQVKVLEAERYGVFRLKPQPAAASFQSSCHILPAQQLKTLVEQKKPADLVRSLQTFHFSGVGKTSDRTSEPAPLNMEPGQTYFFVANGSCLLNGYSGEIVMHGGMGLASADRGRYAVFKTTKAND